MQTIQALVQLGESLFKNSDSPRLDAELIIAHVLNQDRTYLRTWPDKLLTQEDVHQILSLFNRRQQGEPVAYLLGYQEFWSRNFKVTQDTLIPRADTETLIEAVLSDKSIQYAEDSSTPIQVLDLGTGSGIIAITLKLERPSWQVIAVDKSNKALMVAIENANKLAADVHFCLGDWSKPDALISSFQQLQTLSKSQTLFDIIVSNPPYLAEDDHHLRDLQYEPLSALVAKHQGLKAYEDIIILSKRILKHGGLLVVEHGYQQAKAITQLFSENGFEVIAQIKDLGNNDRVLMVRK